MQFALYGFSGCSGKKLHKIRVFAMFTWAVLTYIFLFQVCSIKIESFSYDTENLGLEWHSPGVEFSNVIEIPQFKLEGKKNLQRKQF